MGGKGGDVNLDAITGVYRVLLKRGWRFTDQDGNVLRKCATRPYTHMAINVDEQGRKWLSFHSSRLIRKTYASYTIERVLTIEEKPQ